MCKRIRLCTMVALEHGQHPRVVHGWSSSACGDRRGVNGSCLKCVHGKLVFVDGPIATDVSSVRGVCTALHAVVIIVRIICAGTRDTDNDFEFGPYYHGEAVTPDGLLDTGNTSTFTPLIELAAEGVCLEFEKAELTGGEETMAAGGMDVGDGRVDYGGLGGASDLGKIREKCGKVLEGGGGS